MEVIAESLIFFSIPSLTVVIMVSNPLSQAAVVDVVVPNASGVITSVLGSWVVEVALSATAVVVTASVRLVRKYGDVVKDSVT